MFLLGVEVAVIYFWVIILACIIVVHLYLWRTQPKEYDRGKPLIILDLNGLLMYRQFGPKLSEERPDLLPVLNMAARSGPFYIWERPRAGDFIRQLLSMYRVAVWSSAWPKNVDAAIEYMFGARRSELLFEWSQNESTKMEPHPDTHKASRGVPLFLKELSVVQRCFPLIDPRTIVFVDDNPYKMKNNPVENVVLTTTWDPLDTTDDGLLSTRGVAHTIARTLRNLQKK